MIHKYIKYVMLFVFALVQMQGYALKKSSKKYTFWDESFLTNFSDYEIVVLEKSDNSVYFFVNGTYFSLTSVLDNNNSTCFSDNANTRRVIYTLKNISSNTITTTGSIGWGNDRKLEISGTNLSVSNIQGISHPDLDIYLPLSIGTLSSVTLPSQGELVFSIPFSSNNDSNVTGTLNLKFGSSAVAGGSISNSGTLDNLSISNTIVKGINKPAEVNVSINPYDRTKFTLKAAAGLSNEQVLNKKFYRNGIEVSPDYVLTNNLILTQAEVNGFSYTNLGNAANGVCTESAPRPITITLMTNIPTPGSITIPNSNVCYGGNISVGNGNPSAVSSITSISPLVYSWEFSYDNGVTWNKYGDTQVTEGEDVTTTNASTITIENAQKDVKIRRKVREALGSNTLRYSYSNIITVNVVKPEILFDGKGLNDTPKGSNGIAKVVGSNVQFPVLTVRNTSNAIDPSAKIRVLDENGEQVAINYSGTSAGTGTITIPSRVFNQKGFYKYTIEYQESTSLACNTKEYFNVTIYEPSDCTKYTERVFATLTNSPITGVVNEGLAVDEDLSTKSTITAALTALGLGPRHKVLFDPAKFPGVTGAPIKKGTPIKIKLGQEYSGLNLAGGISLYPLQSNGNRIGTHIDAVEGALLDLLVGDNIFEYTYVAPVDMYGVEVYVGGLLGVAVNASLYGVYIEREVTIPANSTNHCLGNEEIAGAALPLASTIYNNVDTGEPINFPSSTIRLNETVADVCWGVQDVGLGVATSLASVIYPYLAVDDSYETYAIFNKTVAALNRQFLDVKFNQLGRQGDQIQILLSNSGIDILSLNLLADFKAQRYLGDTPVGDEISLNNTALVKLSLVWIDGKRRAAIIVPSDVPFDRVRITYLSIVQVSLGDYTYIHDVSLLPKMYFDGFGELDTKPTICAAEPLLIEKMEACTDYQISFAYKIGQEEIQDIPNSTLISEENLVTINGRDYIRYNFNTLYNQYESLYIKVQAYRKGCAFGEAQYFEIDFVNCNMGIVNPVLRTTAKQ